MDLITIIINVYNGEKYINKCLDSVINQTYKTLEILIINDGSRDNTLKLCKKYKDKRIKIITTENRGLSLSRNIGIDNSTGKYIYFIDADDYMELDTIEYLYNLSKKYNSEITMTKSLDIYDYDFIYKNKKEEVKVLSIKEVLSDVVLEKNNAVTIWNKLIERDLFDGLRYEDRIINDMGFTHKLIMKCNSVLYSNQVKYYYLKHDNSVSKSTDKKRLLDRYEVSLERYNYIKKKYPNFIDNNAGMLRIIIMSDLKDDYFESKKIKSVYNSIFNLKVLFSNIGFREKIKILLFRINPRLNRKCINIYLKLLGKK